MDGIYREIGQGVVGILGFVAVIWLYYHGRMLLDRKFREREFEMRAIERERSTRK